LQILKLFAKLPNFFKGNFQHNFWHLEVLKVYKCKIYNYTNMHCLYGKVPWEIRNYSQMNIRAIYITLILRKMLKIRM